MELLKAVLYWFMEYVVYILHSSISSRFYCGQTDDVAKRLLRHNAGMVKTTKPGIPWIKVWTIPIDSRSEALKLERKIKSRGIKRYMIDCKFNYEEIIGKEM